MARCCVVRTATVVSLAVTLSAVAARSSTCRYFYPFLHPFRDLACSSSATRGFHLYPVRMASCYDSKKSYHTKALTSPYPGSKVERSKIPNDKVDWLVEWEDYHPMEHTAVSVLAGPKWADPQISDTNFSPEFNEKDGQVERKSQSGVYEVKNGRPIWKRDGSGHKVSYPGSGKNILQFIAIKRKDCGEWAIPGGMVDPGEKISAALKREFSEEAMNSLQKSGAETEQMEKQLSRLFSQDHFVVYKGYVDDPRNTDNAWMETEAVNYHDESGEIMDNLHLEPGDDAGKVKWVDINRKLKLYASHADFIKVVAEKRGAHWSKDLNHGAGIKI
uniref:ADP-ribose pyrophosphatase, mitochondrial n=1 Tax=Sphenodon punctatus TaxID=8508 RepID=A0A8D0H2A8_SPHPU